MKRQIWNSRSNKRPNRLLICEVDHTRTQHDSLPAVTLYSGKPTQFRSSKQFFLDTLGRLTHPSSRYLPRTNGSSLQTPGFSRRGARGEFSHSIWVIQHQPALPVPPQRLVSSCPFWLRHATGLLSLNDSSPRPHLSHPSSHPKMDPPAPPPPAARDQEDKGASTQANTQSQAPPNQATGAPHAASVQAPASIPVPDLNALPQGDLANLSLQGLPADLNLLPMLPQDGSLLTDEQLMNMPLMMPMMMDNNGMLNMPQNGMTNGTFLPIAIRTESYIPVQTKSPSMTGKSDSGAYKPNRKFATRMCCSSP